jgi:hypothetical protein
MKAVRGKLAFIVLILLFALFFIVAALSLDQKARLIPLLVGSSTLMLALAALINDIHPFVFIEKMSVDWTEDLRARKSSLQREEKANTKNVLIIICWMLGFFLFIFLLGFHISIALFTFVFLKIEGKVSWMKAILAAGIVWATVFLLFEWMMGLSLFGGGIFGEIIPPI